jgi:molybdate transport system permease protein
VFAAALVVGALVTFLFLAAPIVAIFAQLPLDRVPTLLGGAAVRNALRVTFETNAVAQVAILALGTPTAYLLASRRFRGRSLLVTLVELPLVLPPAVAGIGLLAAFGVQGMLGGTLDALGVRIPFTALAVVVAVTFVAMPYYLRQAIASFEAVDPDLVDASRTLGVSAAGTFRRVVLPLALRGLAAGFALSFARGIGEFGATLFFAGSVGGVTQTLPLAIYEALDTDFTTALALGALLVCLSAAILVSAKVLAGWTRSTSTSPAPYATSR